MTLFSHGWRFANAWAIGVLLAGFAGAPPARAEVPTPVTCKGGMELPSQDFEMGGAGAPEQPDLLVTGVCKVEKARKYFYADVHIYDGGSLEFEQPAAGSPDIDFWAKSIVVEANSALTAGVKAPYGMPRILDKTGGFLTIHLYGKNDSVGDPAKDQGQGVLCKSPLTKDIDGNPVPCGIPPKVWKNNGSTILSGCGNNEITKDSDCIPGLAEATKDYFYQYGPLYGDGKCTNGKTFKVPDEGADEGKALCGGGIPAAGKVGYFGYKVLAVSYGGTLMLRGYKGAADGLDNNHLATGNSWMRLDGDVSSGTSLRVDGTPADRWWLPGDGNRDQVVVTTTDYLPGHSELLTLNRADGVQGDQINFSPEIKWFHSGKRFAINLGVAKDRLEDSGMDKNLIAKGAETRAAVALLTRSIRIVSEGDGIVEKPTPHVETFEEASNRTLCPDGSTKGCYYFGGHTVFRQGFKEVKIKGVEFVNLGQGGKLGHYPVHFHMARQVPPGTIVEDSAVNESNTRWYVLHDTQGVTLQRNVGWKSIGHGFYLENGTEADNNFYSNIGIFARAAIDNKQNPRQIPGILADNQDPTSAKFQKPNIPNPGFPYRSDNEYPTVFWISNGWNNFQGNMAAGAGACGVAYWFVPMENSDTPDVPTDKNQYVDPDPTTPTKHMKWADGGVERDGTVHFGYAGLQRLPLWAGSTPLESFYQNYATSTMMSFQTTVDAPACDGFVAADEAKNNPPTSVPFVAEVASFAPEPERGPRPPPDTGQGPDLKKDKFYPHAIESRKGTRCAVSDFAGLPDCSKPKAGFAGLKTPCTDGTDFLARGFDPNTPNNPMFPCAPTVIDHFTSSFHWAQGDVSAIWLRPQWYLLTNSVLTDVQQGGITFVTGGDVLRASIITGYWGLLRDSLLIGHTQPQDADHKFTLDIGPFNSFTSAAEKCAKPTGSKLPSYCLNKAEGVSLPLTGFFNNQRMENIYDGPSYRDSTAYLDVSTAGCPVGDFNTAIDKCIYGTKQTAGVLKDESPNAKNPCYVPNAAIAWKQPNGFFYPPAFHAENLYFGNVDIRHFVIDPLFEPFKGATPETGDFGQAGSYLTDAAAVSGVYCLPPGLDKKIYFNDFTSIDRQTELNDDDGALTGLSNNIQATLLPPNPLKQTISVNEDDYFTAPVETPECASNIGKNNDPGNACKSPSKAAPTVTAKTSPYDYVSTVIFHTTFGEFWDADCTNPKCYGVPLYRQFLAGNQDKDDPTHKNATREWKHWYQNSCDKDMDTPKCRWPFIRMAGTAKNTRETLTVNNGTYYLDTTVPRDMQRKEPYNTQAGGSSLTASINVFQPDTRINPELEFKGTYNVFFVYAKPTTRQTYQIYLGNKATAAAIKAIRVKLIDLTLDTDFGATQPWLDVNIDEVKDKGIVSVTVDFSKLTGEDKDSLKTIPKNGLCQPLTFCKADGDTCGSAVSDDDPLVKANKDFKAQTAGVCKEWAVKDLDCPPKGCYGFSFTIPKEGFTADASLAPPKPSPHRPAPEPFPDDGKNQGKPTWLVKFLRTTKEPDQTKGQCRYTELPGTNCTVPDWVPQ